MGIARISGSGLPCKGFAEAPSPDISTIVREIGLAVEGNKVGIHEDAPPAISMNSREDELATVGWKGIGAIVDGILSHLGTPFE